MMQLFVGKRSHPSKVLSKTKFGGKLPIAVDFYPPKVRHVGENHSQSHRQFPVARWRIHGTWKSTRKNPWYVRASFTFTGFDLDLLLHEANLNIAKRGYHCITPNQISAAFHLPEDFRISAIAFRRCSESANSASIKSTTSSVSYSNCSPPSIQRYLMSTSELSNISDKN